MEVRIADPVTAVPLPDGRIGEVWLRGVSVARGYWGAERATAETFGGTLATGEGGFLRTGDLGAMYEGELYITGRLKDLLIVRGRNLYPQDIEYEVRALHPALEARHGAAFAVAGSAGPAPAEHVVIVQECTTDLAGDHDRLAAIVALIRDWSARELGFRVGGVVLLPPGGVARTPSGKVQRALMREHFLRGSLDALYEDLVPELGRQYREESANGRYGRPAVARGTA
jgi:acyl-CoA synthetase (AMP-forming)/AMP-acid ligase II